MSFVEYLTSKRLKETFDQGYLNMKRTVGTDGKTLDRFAYEIDEEVEIIARKIANRTYRISPYREKLILKGRDRYPRTISIPTHRDNLTLRMAHRYLARQYGDTLPSRSVSTMVSTIKKHLTQGTYTAFIKIDIQDFYPSIDHTLLLEKIGQQSDDPHLLHLIERAVQQATISGKKNSGKPRPNTRGVPQGLPISNLLASIYLKELDRRYMGDRRMAYFRFVDDILILCDLEDLEGIQRSILGDMEALKLRVHPFVEGSSKSSVGRIGEDTFEYLGFVFGPKSIKVREASIERMRKRIREVFIQNEFEGRCEMTLYNKIRNKVSGCVCNGKRYGWMHYFAPMTDLTQLYHLDWYVKKCFKEFGYEYNPPWVKTFVKTYYYLKSHPIDTLTPDTYVPKYRFDPEKDQAEIELDLDWLDLDEKTDKSQEEKTPEKSSQKSSQKPSTTPSDLARTIDELKKDVLVYGGG